MDDSRDELYAIWSHVLEHIQFGIVLSDVDTRELLRVNRAYAALLGYEPAELVGVSGESLIAEASRPEVVAARAALDAVGHHTYPLGLIHRDGRVIPVLAWSSTVDTGTRPLRVSSVIDMSERVQLVESHAAAAAAAALAVSAARLEQLAVTSHELAALSGDLAHLLPRVAQRLAELIGDGCVVRLNSADGAWLEPSPDAVYHRVPARRAAAQQVFGSLRQRMGEGLAGRVAAGDVSVRLNDVDLEALIAAAPAGLRALLAEDRPTSLLVVPLRSRDRTIGVVSLIRNPPSPAYSADDQHFAQELANRAGLAIDNATLVATLEQRVAERTAKLEVANHELEAFGYSVSHDLRAPLRTIVAFSQALHEDHAAALPAEAARDLERIRSAAGRMSHLIDDLLALSRATRGAVVARSFDLTALAHAVIAELRRREPTRTTPIHVAEGLIAPGDPRLIEIVLENLLGNAWKFTAKHPGAEIAVGRDGDAFFVRDTGVGFDPAQADRLFEPFHRLHPREDYEGSGIGLATVARIVERHGGRVWAEGAIERGATIYFTLPGT